MLVNVFDGNWNGGYLVDGGRNLLQLSNEIKYVSDYHIGKCACSYRKSYRVLRDDGFTEIRVDSKYRGLSANVSAFNVTPDIIFTFSCKAYASNVTPLIDCFVMIFDADDKRYTGKGLTFIKSVFFMILNMIVIMDMLQKISNRFRNQSLTYKLPCNCKKRATI